MRINNISINTSDVDSREIRKMKIKIAPMESEAAEPDVDVDDEKQLDKFIKSLKSKIRGCREYNRLMNFLKQHRSMDKCFYLPRIKQTKGSKIKIEQHHNAGTLYDIIQTVILKRAKCGESLKAQFIAKEVMQLHYEGKISLVPLSSTMHALIHADDSELFIPVQDSEFGDSRLFFDEYAEYMEGKTRKSFEKLFLMSEAVENIDDIIPDTIDVNIIYYEEEGVEVPDMGRIAEIIEAA